MKWLVPSLIFLLFALYPRSGLSKTLTIAVIDTGIDAASNTKLCKQGHKSFDSRNTNPLQDPHGHGTHIAGLIVKEAGNRDYCIVSLTFYNDNNTGKQNLQNMIAAITYAVNIKADFINISGGGPEFSEDEYLAVRRGLAQGTKFVVAAGNEHSNLDVKCDYFPACYDKKIISVGNLMITKDMRNLDDGWRFLAMVAGMADKLDKFETARASTSNYGKRVSRWEVGDNVKSTLPGGKMGYMSGTSQATGVATGKLVKERLFHAK